MFILTCAHLPVLAVSVLPVFGMVPLWEKCTQTFDNPYYCIRRVDVGISVDCGFIKALEVLI